MENIDWEHLDSLLWTGEKTNIKLAVTIAKGMQVLPQWFSYRRASRERPIIGDRRPPSPLGEIQPEGWLPEYTTELLNLLNVLGRLVDLEPTQADLLERICSGPLIPASDLPGLAVKADPRWPGRVREGQGELPFM